jgi:hypothetical protein
MSASAAGLLIILWPGWVLVGAKDSDSRLACWITASAWIRLPVSVTVSKKSQASSASAWARRKVAQLVILGKDRVRRGR